MTDWKNDDLRKTVIVPRHEKIQIHLAGHRPFSSIRSLRAQSIGI